jgi:hypothetical protein
VACNIYIEELIIMSVWIYLEILVLVWLVIVLFVCLDCYWMVDTECTIGGAYLLGGKLDLFYLGITWIKC